MSHGDEGTAWITVQNHLNVVAVAALIDCACIILPEGITMEQNVIDKAIEEKIPILSSKLTGYELCKKLSEKGIGS